jgi:uncharacterized protein (DUF488 family)
MATGPASEMLDCDAHADGLPIAGTDVRVCLQQVLRDRIPAPMTLFTFGYEGLAIDVFIARLKKAGVRTVLDVRQLPLSRKPGFSKGALSTALHTTGIVYAHVPALGCPRPIRDRYKIDGDWAAYVKAFSAYLAEQGEAVAELARIAKKTSACLVCFEADFNRCHRSIVARATARAGGPRVIHLTLKGEIPDVAARAVA